jgi:hypothetical protein
MMRLFAPVRAGDVVEVRSKEEILRTLDGRGELDGLPFMPEMLQYCGRRFRVAAVAHKTCETARRTWKARRLRRAVHLEALRCDGSAHGGCQAECSLFWREEWLQPVTEGGVRARLARPTRQSSGSSGCGEDTLLDHTKSGGEHYSCQATRLYEASEPLRWWDPRQYLRDVASGNHSLGHVCSVLALAALTRLLAHTPRGHRIIQSLRGWVHRAWKGRELPDVEGAIPVGKPTPTGRLHLSPGELVRIKSRSEIERTLNTRRLNRGLSFDEEMSAHCGDVGRVRRLVTRIIDEGTGTMREMENPCVTLEGMFCKAEYSRDRLLCPRAIPPYFREIWLERVAPAAGERESDE